ncbi:PAS domain-containing sensor histidine kinase [Salegentibacter sp. JZCK2]|uniref:PAS domain-containing sensor histidine kinase n=1 Tax=Salegentibacter tibetensis TaxID=2873600 RepID=UPI001CD0070F|nr:PAS domain-containing sensor histidine kinase [Salegentibacter tibetensis]MBZ9728272.1 PAS domain-containing sensor histidine kinase [Salegentibacter tibetensis]
MIESDTSKLSEEDLDILKNYAQGIIRTVREPLLVIDQHKNVVDYNANFKKKFKVRGESEDGVSVFAFNQNQLDTPEFREILEDLENDGNALNEKTIRVQLPENDKKGFTVNASVLSLPNGSSLFLFSFKKLKKIGNLSRQEKVFNRIVEKILSNAPASICILKGPEHIFEVANENYLKLVGHRNIIGKSVKEALPEVGSQGFLELLDNVYSSGEAYVGDEILIKLNVGNRKFKNSYLNFVYEPTRNQKGDVDGVFVHAIDVTEQVKARKTVEDSETRLRDVINTVPAIIWITDINGQSVFLNKNWYSYTGQGQKAAEGMGWLDAIHPEDRKQAEFAFLEGHDQKKAYTINFRLRNKKGEHRWVLDKASPKFDAEGKYEGMIGTVVDVHEEKIKEHLVREKEHRMQGIVKEATVATAIYTGLDMNIELANDAMIDLWGKDQSVLGKTLNQALPELEGQPFGGILENVYKTGETYWGKEDRVDLRKDGKMQTGFYNFTYKPLRDKNGEIYGILNMAIDVTDSVKSKMLLKESEFHFRQMADLMPGMVSKTDGRGSDIYFNKNWLDFTGHNSEQLKEIGWVEYIHPEEKETYVEAWDNCLDTGCNLEMQLRLKNKAGKYIWHLSRCEAVKEDDGTVKMWIAANTEIDKIKEEEKRKEEFLKMVSHELKTPITSIKGYVQLLLGLLKKEQEEEASNLPLKPSLERINHQVSRLTRLISEILDLSRVRENQLELKTEKFNLNDLVAETIQDINYTNTQHKISLESEVQCYVSADRDRIGQVIINFVMNAIKYSPGSQEINVRISKESDCEVKVSVKDFGIGIGKENHKKIFKRFYRVGVKGEETYSGFGIGLYLANEIIERHNGEIKLKSKLGEGSEFSFILNAAQITSN